MPNRSRSELLNLLDSIAEGIYGVDLDGNCTYCNTPCVSLLGYRDKSELLGQNMHALIHHHHRDGTVYDVQDCKIVQACHSDRFVHVENEVFFRKDGSHFDVEYRSFPIKENDEIVGAVVSFLDITVRRVEASNRNHLAQLVESSFDGIISRDLDGRITSWNQGATQIYGYDAEEALGEKVKDLILPAGTSAEEPEIRNAINEGTELLQFHVKRRHKKGDVLDISLTISPLFDADGKLIGCSSIERDISEHRRSQDAILDALSAAKRAEGKAEKANRTRAEFLANVSHELRTPMNAILGMLQLCLDEDLTPVLRDYLTLAKTSADSLLDLVNELLDFAKIESGKFELHSEEFNLRDSIDVPAKALATQASEKGIELLCEVDSEIPDRLIGDERRFQQIITNLLSNAVKFTDRGEIIVKVRQLRRLPGEVRLRFSVTDTGIGIAPAHQEKIMLPFEQADMSTTREQQGTGLGLSICKELVSLMGGKLRLRSQPDQGSTFWFDLSLPAVQGSTEEVAVPSDNLQGIKVLIVDDNPTNLRILEKIFVSWSMQPIVCDSAEQALMVLDEAKQCDYNVSLALIDCLMPQMDGFKLSKKLIDEHGEECPPIIMMQSAADLSMYAERQSTSAVTSYLTKPVSQSELLNAVVSNLGVESDSSQQRRLNELVPELDPPPKELRILLVEDLPANQKVAKAILEKRGHQVETAGNGRVAIEKITDEPAVYDVVLMDVQMPVMDGLQATEAIRSLEDSELSETPIIAMTAHAMQGDREICLAAGMDAYLRKPLDAKKLVEVTESIVHEHRSDELGPASQSAIHQPVSSAAVAKHRLLIDREEGQGDSFQLVELESSLQRLDNDRGLFLEFIEIFMSDAPPIMQTMETAVDAGDFGSLERAAHALKGLMSNFGAKRCCELATRLEQAGRNSDPTSLSPDLSTLQQLYGQLCEELRSLRS